MIAFGYSRPLVTVWETQHHKDISQLSMEFHKENMTIPKYIDGEVDSLLWHPSSGEIIGLQRDGLLFKWDPYDDESIIKVRVEQAYRLTISRDGSRLATGDGEHVIKIFATADLSFLHSLSTQGSIRSLSFSTSSRRVYDVRGKYGNVWEPSILVDPTSTVGALTYKEEYQFFRAQNITAVCGQSTAAIYCYGTENGPAMLREVGSRAAWELENESDNVPIHKLALSENENLTAIADMSGKVSITQIPSNKLPYTILPQDVTSRIREALALLSHGRLLFLDTELWICSWVVSSVATEASQCAQLRTYFSS
ncbi:hypothetical protein V502_11383 [Pseudogymnoascus sp. VKM F-4520 (FW-2644)]|nr:hypothetical protein V502_11383 [Pseudogymnoascus sp. VKM F-4520 (FW-2644)]